MKKRSLRQKSLLLEVDNATSCQQKLHGTKQQGKELQSIDSLT